MRVSKNGKTGASQRIVDLELEIAQIRVAEALEQEPIRREEKKRRDQSCNNRVLHVAEACELCDEKHPNMNENSLVAKDSFK